jgi:ABC-type transport system involved in multi-copper enzyme maturation permease subunit
MLEQLLAIIRNTFFESIRQPVVLVVLLVATLLLIISNPLAAFTMEDDQRMLVDIGLATIFVAGALLAALVATGVLTREIENKTALTVI